MMHIFNMDTSRIIYIRRELLDTLAQEVAKLLGNRGMKSGQMRSFFSALRRLELRLRLEPFAAIQGDLIELKGASVYRLRRELVPLEFVRFIELNVDVSVQDAKSFRYGFVRHFQSVLAYFVYYFGGDSGE